jgi:hypothetical protein
MTWTPSPDASVVNEDRDLRSRIRAEFSEMPGLMLTLAQASRLFNVELTRCDRVLSALVDLGAISTNGRTFVRVGAGRQCA